MRQGDQLSPFPFLFILPIEGLHIAIQEAIQSHIFEVIKLPLNGPIISHILYSDDVMFIDDWSNSNALNLSHILHCFYLTSGLKFNYKKQSFWSQSSE